VRSSMDREAQAPEVIVSEQVTFPGAETVLSQAAAATSLAVDPVRPAVRRLPVPAAGRPSLPSEPLSITIQLFESRVAMDAEGAAEVPVAVVNCPMDVTPEYSFTVVSKTEPPERVTVTAEIAGQLSPTQRARASKVELTVVSWYGKTVHPEAVTLVIVCVVPFHATPTTTASPAVVAAESAHGWLAVVAEVWAQVVADPLT